MWPRLAQFLSGDSGVICRDLGVIARRYARSWLLIDLASTAPGPVDLFLSLQLDGCSDSSSAFSAATDEDSGSGSVLKLMRALKIAKLMKLMRLLRPTARYPMLTLLANCFPTANCPLFLLLLLRLNQLLERLHDHFPINNFISKAFTLIVLVLYIGHLTACLWYWIGTQSYARDTELFTGERASWLITAGFIVEPRPWEGDNATVFHATLGEKYVGSFYWAFTTMTTVGYGDITPTTARERLFTVAAMMVGASLFGYIIGNVTSLVGNSHASAKQLNAHIKTLTFTLSTDPNTTLNPDPNPDSTPNHDHDQARMETLNHYMTERALPRSLQVSIRKYYRYFWSRRTVFEHEEEILSNLSTPLRAELLRFMYRDVILQIPLFEVCPTLYNLPFASPI